jgi:hypothetical protein
VAYFSFHLTGGFCRLAIPEEGSSSLRKIPKLEDPAHSSKLGLVVRSFGSSKFFAQFSKFSVCFWFSAAQKSRSGHEPAC